MKKIKVYVDTNRPAFEIEADDWSIDNGILMVRKDGIVVAVFNYAFWASFVTE